MATLGDPIALAAYEALAAGYSARAETKAENGYNEHPAMRKQIGDVAGLCVLDAGCGPGFLVRDLLAAGASKVVGFDISPAMIALAKSRVGHAATLFIADLAKPLATLQNGSFDLVVSSLAMDYVRDWCAPLGEFRRVLKPGGRLVMSVQHPMGAYKWFKPQSAFGVQYCEASWRGFTDKPVIVPDYYRSFEEVINPILSMGFRLRCLKETQPVPELKAIDPRKYKRGSEFPTFLIIDAEVR
ncbi:MAG: class I SAM-dependent methyltransferase [Pseudomonadota bacterium]